MSKRLGHAASNHSNVVTIADHRDTYNFTRGMPLRMTNAGELVLASRSWRFVQWLKRLAWWRQARVVVTAIDTECGTITTAPLVWSWIRWKWVRP